MSEFNISCPGCRTTIQVSSDQAGQAATCPRCKGMLIIPASPDAQMPEKPKLSVATSTAEMKTGGFAPGPPRVYKKKKKFPVQLVAGLLGGAVALVLAVHFGTILWDKYKARKEAEEAAEAAANQPPPPPPPEPGATEIMKKVVDKYKTLSSYTAQAMTTANLDYSKLYPNNPNAQSQQFTSSSSLELGRPDYYRIEWSRQAGAAAVKGAVWSSGMGNFVSTGMSAIKVKNRDTAINAAGTSSGALSFVVASLFFDDTNSLAAVWKNVAKTNSEEINSQDCFVLTGDWNYKQARLWVNKSNFLIAQAAVINGGQLDDAAYRAETSYAVKTAMLTASKIQGAVTETYQDINVNKTLPADIFSKPIPAATANN